MNGSAERWVGIDVSKSKLDVAWLGERGRIKSHVFDNDARGHGALIAWLQSRACEAGVVRVCMEATGPYGEAAAVARALRDPRLRARAAPARRVRALGQPRAARADLAPDQSV